MNDAVKHARGDWSNIYGATIGLLRGVESTVACWHCAPHAQPSSVGLSASASKKNECRTPPTPSGRRQHLKRDVCLVR